MRSRSAKFIEKLGNVNSSELSPNVNSLDIAKTRAESLIEKLVIFLRIDRVVGDNGDRIIFQRIPTPRPGPRVTHRDTWIPQQQQQKELQPQPQHSESGACSRKPVQSGDRNESRNEGNDVASGSASTGKPVLSENEVIQSSGIDLRVDGITQEEIYDDQQYMDELKKQVERLQDESISQSMNKDLQQGVLLSEETSLKIKHPNFTKYDNGQRYPNSRSA